MTGSALAAPFDIRYFGKEFLFFLFSHSHIENMVDTK